MRADHLITLVLSEAKKTSEFPWVKTTHGQRAAALAGSEVIHDDPELTVRRVHTHAAMRVLGSRTSWCVVPDRDAFDSYEEQGYLHHIHNKKTGERHLLNLEAGELKDADNNDVDSHELAQKHPVLNKVFPHGQSYHLFSDKGKLDQEIIAGKHAWSHIALQAAQHSKNPDVLHALRHDDYDPERRRMENSYEEDGNLITTAEHVAVNKHTHPHTLDAMVREKETNPNIKLLVAQHQSTGADTLDFLARHPRSKPRTLEAVAYHPNIAPKTLKFMKKKYGLPR